jgi:protein phosphatase 1 regulatory subunit 7
MENLEGLVSLEELYLSHNGLTKLEGLEKNVSVLPTGHYDPPIVWVLILTYLL